MSSSYRPLSNKIDSYEYYSGGRQYTGQNNSASRNDSDSKYGLNTIIFICFVVILIILFILALVWEIQDYRRIHNQPSLVK